MSERHSATGRRPDLKASLHKKLELPFFEPMLEARQTVSRRPALFSGHLSNERFHVLAAFVGPWDARAKLLLDKGGGNLTQLEISRELIATIPWRIDGFNRTQASQKPQPLTGCTQANNVQRN